LPELSLGWLSREVVERLEYVVRERA